MCRYAVAYREHWACFGCRKMFRRRSPKEWPSGFKIETGRITQWPDKAAHAACPQCRGAMHNMGLDFKAPSQNDEKQWQKVRLLSQNGVRWSSCGCSGPGYGKQLRTLRSAREFLARREAGQSEQRRRDEQEQEQKWRDLKRAARSPLRKPLSKQPR